MGTTKLKRVDGDRYALIAFYGLQPYALTTDTTLAGLLAQVPEHVTADDERVSVCEVTRWAVRVGGDPTDYLPLRIRTLYEIEPYGDANEDDDETDTSQVFHFGG